MRAKKIRQDGVAEFISASLFLFPSTQTLVEERAAHTCGENEHQIELVLPCSDHTAEGHVFKEDFFVDMRCDKGVPTCNDEQDAEHVINARHACGTLQMQAAQYAVPDRSPVKTRMNADDEVEEDGGAEMRRVDVDGGKSAQTDDGNGIERDEDSCHNHNDEEREHHAVDDVEW